MATTSLWEAPAGRAPGRPVGPAEPALYERVLDRLNPAKARPHLRDGIEEAHLDSVRGAPYVMLRSPGESPAYLRLDPTEVELAHLMDGSRTVADLVAAFARLSGRLAPQQVLRVVADLAGNEMLQELPIDAFHPVRSLGRVTVGHRVRRSVGDILRGRQFAVFKVDRAAELAYRAGGWLFFTRIGVMVAGLVAALGAIAFAATWAAGDQAVFVMGGSHILGAFVLLGLNVVCVAAHELGHALAAKHAGRQVPKAGVMLYFGIPSVFVDTSDVWMAGRRARLVTAASGPAAALVLAGAINLVGVAVPEVSAAAFKLGFLWYLNVIFNLNPLLALDGYHLLMDWLELPNLRARGLALTIDRLRQRRFGWGGLTGEHRLYAMYGTAGLLWLVVTVGLGIRLWKDRVDGLGAALWHDGIGGQAGVALIIAMLFAPILGAAFGRAVAASKRWWTAHRRRDRAHAVRDRLDVLRRSVLVGLAPDTLAALASRAWWLHPRNGALIQLSEGSVVVAAGVLEGVSSADGPGVVRRRALTGDVVRQGDSMTAMADNGAGGNGAGGIDGVDDAIDGWRVQDARLLVLPGDAGELPVEPRAFEWRQVAPEGHRGSPHAALSPALVWPAGATSSDDDGAADRRLGRRFLWLLLVLFGLAVSSLLVAVPPGRAWSELGADQLLARVERGSAVIRRPAGDLLVTAGDQVAVAGGATIDVLPDSEVSLTFPGGSSGRVCPGSVVDVRAVSAARGELIEVLADLGLQAGALSLSLASPSARFADLEVAFGSVAMPDATAVASGRSGAARTAAVVSHPDGTVRMVPTPASTEFGAWCQGISGVAAEPQPTPGPPAGVVPHPSPSMNAPHPPATSAPGTAETPAAAPSDAAVPSDQATPAAPSSPGAPGTSGGAPSVAPSTPTASPARLAPPRTHASPTPRPSPTPTPVRRPSPTPTPVRRPSPTPAPTPKPEPGEFTIECAPEVVAAEPGQAATTTCSVTATGSSGIPVTPGCQGLGAIAACTAVPSSLVVPGGSSESFTVTIRVASGSVAAPGCYPFEVFAGSSIGTKSDQVMLDVRSGTRSSCPVLEAR